MVLILSFMSLGGWGTTTPGHVLEKHDPSHCMDELLERAFAFLKSEAFSEGRWAKGYPFWQYIQRNCSGYGQRLYRPPGWQDHQWGNGTTLWSRESQSEKEQWEGSVTALAVTIENFLQELSPSWVRGKNSGIFGPLGNRGETMPCFWLEERLANGKRVVRWNEDYAHGLIHSHGHEFMEQPILNTAAKRLVAVEDLRCRLAKGEIDWKDVQATGQQLPDSFKLVTFRA